jgi:hypothetical protein
MPREKPSRIAREVKDPRQPPMPAPGLKASDITPCTASGKADALTEIAEIAIIM